jgi:hypothetical protein
MEDADSGYTIDQHLAPTGVASHELLSCSRVALGTLPKHLTGLVGHQ